MIRPITIVTFLMACGSGLYLYQSKHEVQLLDRTIEKSVRDTTALREQSRLLATEWTMLNDPDRLRQFSDTYLNLKSINPAQFTSLTDLGNRLPAPQLDAPVAAPIDTPVSAGDAPAIVADADSAPTTPATIAPTAEPKPLPLPPTPAVRPTQVATSTPHARETRPVIARPAIVADAKPVEPRAMEPKVADQRTSDARPVQRLAEIRPEPRSLEPRSPEPRSPEPRSPEARSPEARSLDQRTSEPRPQLAAAPKPIVLAAPRPRATDAQPVYAPSVAVAAPVPAQYHPARAPVPAAALPAAPYSGSLLGMARGSAPPAPRPMPVNATYNAN